MPQRIVIASALALAVGANRNCLTNAGPSAAGCDCSGVGGAATCTNNQCICSGGGCAGSDARCYDGQGNTQVGGAGKIYRIRNARWPKWYLESESSAARLWVGKGKDTAAARTYQWTLHALPAATQSTSYLMFTEFRRDNALTYGTERVCSVVINGTELDLEDNTTQAADGVLANEGPGPEGFPVAGQGINGEDLASEFIVENETARLEEIAGRSQDDPDGDWFEDDEENQELKQMVRREEMSYRSRSGSYYSRSRYSSYYSRSRSYSSYYSRSRSSYSRSRSYSSYGAYSTYSNYGHYDNRRRVYCRNVLVGNAISTAAQPTQRLVTMKLTKAPATDGAAQLFMLSAAQYPDRYLFIPKFSSSVDINAGDPGAGGYWFFDPPLPGSEVAKAPAYTGGKCSSFCGSVGNIKDVGTAFVNKAFKQSGSLMILMVLGAGASLSVL